MPTTITEPGSAEYLETDGLGGFASGTISGIRTRRYHALLLSAAKPPSDRFVLVSGCETFIQTERGRYALSSERYAPDVIAPDGVSRVRAFRRDPWPSWTYELEGGGRVEREIFFLHGTPLLVVSFRVSGVREAALELRPLLAVRGFHELARETSEFVFDPEFSENRVTFRPRAGAPGVLTSFDGSYRHAPLWYRRFHYTEEARRGLDCEEDLAAPGVFHVPIRHGEAAIAFARECPETIDVLDGRRISELAREIRLRESSRRAELSAPDERAADAYVVERGAGRTLIAGYPWFGDWGRDTFIALRGLCLSLGHFEEASEILCEWAKHVSEGMLPNRFPDAGEAPEYNSVDASLWFAVVVGELLERAPRDFLSPDERRSLADAVIEIIEGYRRGTRHGIIVDPRDGLIAAGAPGVQLTWMDAKTDGHVVTPRTGKPVEIQALFVRALEVAARFDARYLELAKLVARSLAARFWDETRGCLFDVIDVDHVDGRVDRSFRPNQIFAVGGLGAPRISIEQARRVVDAVEAQLWTPLGLRSLDPADANYQGRYSGSARERDQAYHQGTVWPWLLGPFVEAWVLVRGDGLEHRRAARDRFLSPLTRELEAYGLGHVSEVADGDPPHQPGGCPFQAWSLGELVRLEREILAETAPMKPGARPSVRPNV